MISQDDLTFDQQHIWHPYTSLTNPIPTYPVVSARGVKLTLQDGNELIDGCLLYTSDAADEMPCLDLGVRGHNKKKNN